MKLIRLIVCSALMASAIGLCGCKSSPSYPSETAPDGDAYPEYNVWWR